MIYIYGIYDKDKVLYVGSSANPRRRLSEKRKTFKIYDLTLKILQETDDDNWGKDERRWIAELKPEKNRHPGGGGGCTWRPDVTLQFRKKKSEDVKKAWQNPDTRNNLLSRNKARWSDPDQIQRHVEKHRGAK